MKIEIHHIKTWNKELFELSILCQFIDKKEFL